MNENPTMKEQETARKTMIIKGDNCYFVSLTENDKRIGKFHPLVQGKLRKEGPGTELFKPYDYYIDKYRGDNKGNDPINTNR